MTNPETEPVTGAVDGIGITIRRARSTKGLSIRELARRVNVSASFISQVELGKAAPSMGLMFSIASELGISLDTLMTPVGPGRPSTQPDTGPPPGLVWRTEVNSAEGLPNVQRADERARVDLGNVHWERLTRTDIEGAEFLQIVYPPGSESCPADALQRHSGWEFGVILTGAMHVQVGFSSGTLAAGDSIHFSSTIPHRLSNPSDTPCTALWIVLGRVNSKSGPTDQFG